MVEKNEKNLDTDAATFVGSDGRQTKVVSAEVDEDAAIDGVDPIYAAKAKVLNRALQDIGMGRYQWQLFFVIGFGWAQDNLYPIITSLILAPVATEFAVKNAPLLSLAQNIGLLAGALFWGFGCDIFGRKWGFNLTLGVTAVFALISASSPNFAAIGTFAALWSFGVGGNLPVDSAIFLEFLPRSHQYLLTVLSIFWAFAQLLATLIAWPLLGYRTCQVDTVCTRSANMGWRYFLITMGGLTLIMFIIRFFIFHIYESPKYLMGKGRDEDAVKIVHEVARRNGRESNLTIEELRACDRAGGLTVSGDATNGSLGNGIGGVQTGSMAAIKRKLAMLNGDHVGALFATRKLAFSTSMIMTVWAFIGLAFPLYNAFIPYTLSIRGAEFGDGSTYLTYRNSCIIAVLGVPGAMLGGVLVEIKRFGRKGALATSTILTGVFIYGSTTAKTSDQLLAWNCVYSFFSNVMYAVLYAYTPEIFPTKDRGTGNALTACANRVFGIMAPIIAIFANLETAAPVYTSGALFIAAGLVVVILPYESRGRASL